MDEKAMQSQIAELNNKVDILLDYVNQQRLKTNQLEDLVADLTIVGKDVYDTTVEEFDKSMVELDIDEIRVLAIKLIRNLPNIRIMLNTFESTMDLLKDVSPLANEIIIDFTKKVDELNQKGYIDFVKESAKIFDNIVSHYKTEDVTALADNIVTIVDTVRDLTQPEVMKSVDNAVRIYGSIEMDNIPEYSMWKMFREMNKPEMKRAMGFMVTFMKNISNQNK